MNVIGWNRCALLGAAGKMGRGIALILLLGMAKEEASILGKVGQGGYRLTLIDIDLQGLDTLKEYLQEHVRKYAEKQINTLRDAFVGQPQLISNREVIDYFVEGTLKIAHFSSTVESAKDVPVVFESVIEDLALKSRLLRSLVAASQQPPYVFTNTSSIPITLLDQQAKLGGHLIGFHFFNPPPIQPLVEIIPQENSAPGLMDLAKQIGNKLHKTLVFSKDVAGFIGNGHFMREAVVACSMVEDLSRCYPFPLAIYMVNRITGEFLLRPMGIFQLLDYVGLDVMAHVSRVMREHLPIDSQIDWELWDRIVAPLLATSNRGGQYPDGSQKSGFFSYLKLFIVGLYIPAEGRYANLSQDSWGKEGDAALGPLPNGYRGWAELSRQGEREGVIVEYLQALHNSDRLGCQLASKFLKSSGQIIQKLIDDGVAASRTDVETVLKQGFYHLYAAV